MFFYPQKKHKLLVVRCRVWYVGSAGICSGGVVLIETIWLEMIVGVREYEMEIMRTFDIQSTIECLCLYSLRHRTRILGVC